MPYTKLCRKWHIDRQKEKDREKELIGSVSVINRLGMTQAYLDHQGRFTTIRKQKGLSS